MRASMALHAHDVKDQAACEHCPAMRENSPQTLLSFAPAQVPLTSTAEESGHKHLRIHRPPKYFRLKAFGLILDLLGS